MAYKHVIRAKTKNLFDINSNSEKGFYNEQGEFFPTPRFLCFTIDVISNNTYCISTSKLGSVKGIVSFWNNNTFVSARNNGEHIAFAYTVPSGANKLKFVIEDSQKYSDIQVELGSTPTPYTPYNYLSSNKRMIKVSDVCQIVDKSQLITEQRNTVSLTNNGDGSISLTGAATDYEWVPITQISNRKIIKGHVYLLGGNSYKNSLVAMYGRCILSTGNKDFGYFSYNNEWVRFISAYTGYFQIMLQMRDVILDNFKITPQFFDLTEMYGAGHEPATVVEFTQRFPNEYYPYSPQCWLTSYKSAVVCKTKNLFDVNNAVPYTFTNDNPPSSRISLKDGIYTTTYNNYNVGSGLRIKDGLVLSPGTYTLSLSVITVGETTPITGLTYGFRLYKSDGTKPVITTYTEKFNSRCSHTFTIPADCTDIRLYLAPHCNSGQEYVYISLKDIQLEQGSTATSYVPYQHL